jgi:hypothetical protein
VLLGLIGAACTGSDDAVSPTATPPSEPVELGTLPAVTTSEVISPGLEQVATTIESAIVTIEDPIPPSADDFVFAAPLVVEFAGLPLTDISISPSGDWIAANRESKICLLDTSIGSVSADAGCVEFAGSISPGSLAWSPDESTVAFHHEVFRSGQDADIVVLDIPSRRIEVLTDDGVDDAETGTIDITPFFSEDGTLHFFRLDSDPFSPTIIEFSDTLTPIDDVEFEGLPRSTQRDPIGGGIAVASARPDGGNGFLSVTIDLVKRTSTLAESEAFRWFIDVSGGRALIDLAGIPEVDGPRAAVIDLWGTAESQPVPSASTDSDRSVVGFGLSPDGTEIIMIIEHQTDPAGHQLAVAPILDDGSVGPLSVIATGPEFAPNNNEVTIRPHGLGWLNEIVWTQDRIVFGLGPNQIVTLDIAS